MEFEVRISGDREGCPLTVATLDVDEWIGAMTHARDLLYPDGKHRARVNVRLEEGSVRLILTAAASVVIPLQAVLAEASRTHRLDILQPRQIEAVRYFQKEAIEKNFAIQLGESNQLSSGLMVDRSTSWEEKSEPIWVNAELYVTGTVINIGGKVNSNIHLDTKELGTLIVDAPREWLQEDPKNRLYKDQHLHISIMQNVETGEYDSKSARLIEFLDVEEKKESPDDYLDRLIGEAAKDWAKVEDPEVWLREIRGYED